jgi:hypothetical protein
MTMMKKKFKTKKKCWSAMLLYLTILMIFRQRNWEHFGKFVVSLKNQIQQILLNVSKNWAKFLIWQNWAIETPVHQ